MAHKGLLWAPRRQALLWAASAAVPAIVGEVSAESAKASTTDLHVTGLEAATVTGTSVIITWFTATASPSPQPAMTR